MGSSPNASRARGDQAAAEAAADAIDEWEARRQKAGADSTSSRLTASVDNCAASCSDRRGGWSMAVAMRVSTIPTSGAVSDASRRALSLAAARRGLFVSSRVGVLLRAFLRGDDDNVGDSVTTDLAGVDDDNEGRSISGRTLCVSS